MAKEIEVTCHWRSYHIFEVDDDWEDNGSLDNFTEDQLDDMTPVTAELVDWDVI